MLFAFKHTPQTWQLFTEHKASMLHFAWHVQLSALSYLAQHQHSNLTQTQNLSAVPSYCAMSIALAFLIALTACAIEDSRCDTVVDI